MRRRGRIVAKFGCSWRKRLSRSGGNVREHGELVTALKNAAEARGHVYAFLGFRNQVIAHLRVESPEKLAHVCGQCFLCASPHMLGKRANLKDELFR